MRKGESEIGESVNCDEGWMSGSRTKAFDLSAGVVARDIGGERLGATGGFIGVHFERSGTNDWSLLSGEELVEDEVGG